MLVLGRAVGESIVIGPDILVKITAVHCGYVKIAISAPPDVKIDRLEVFMAKRASGRDSNVDRPEEGG